ETCSRQSCLMPEICKNLSTSHKELHHLLDSVQSENPKTVVASGIRHDLALKDREYIKIIARYFTGGLLKLAPEHCSATVLKSMNKPSISLFEKFSEIFKEESKAAGKTQHIVPYIIVGHPGETLADTVELALWLKKNKMRVKQVQEFTPTPMSISTCMYFTEKDFNTGKPVYVAKGREKRLMKALVQWFMSENRKLVREALEKADRRDLIQHFVRLAKNQK
ncbi:MAG: DUF3362 domain-containing protein, partial [Candidatus Cloacimonetes bacterium]|nr:DUF3362 domain-containing protein [Candidatus Cloacimonadota bacterium]